MTFRAYRSADCPALAALFHQTVHRVNAKDYTREQLDAWATGQVNLEQWDQSLRIHRCIVAEENGVIVGFGDMDKTGYLDRLYVHADYQRQGIATEICTQLEQGVSGTITTHASITAKPFFLHRGYRIIREQQVIRHGVSLTNFVMEKPAEPET